jgi:hypothetical protein
MHTARAAQGGLELSRFITLYQSRCHFQTTILENIQNYEKLKGAISLQTAHTICHKNIGSLGSVYYILQT